MSFIFANGTAAAGVATTLRTVGVASKACFDIDLCKTVAGTATVNLYVVNGATTSYLEHGVAIPYGTPLERTKKMFGPGCIIKVLSDVDIDYTLAGTEGVA